MKVSILILAVLAVSIGSLGCSGSKQAADDAAYDISWFVAQMEDSGVSLSTRGAPANSGRAVSSSRLILNNLDVVDIYEFADESVAYEEGLKLLALRGHRDVYVKSSLLIVHIGRDGSGVRPILFETLGKAL
ncbi:MAG: hypothetical protein HKN43_04640 [Rhodothermales bacterium]|nr:hypothetical protein [Rhodothermales bacterium]